MMDDLAAWLTQIWDEDEAAARDGDAACWHIDYCDAAGSAFHERFTPPLMLARIAADRRILEVHEPDPRLPSVCTTCGEPLEYTVDWPCETVRLLASPYADRPGYREEWAC